MSACTSARAKRERTDEEFAETASGRHASAFRIECHGQDRTAAVRSRLLGCFALCRAGAGADPHLGFGGRRRRQPCSRTAPCKTFPGAISKTAAGGEITVSIPAASAA